MAKAWLLALLAHRPLETVGTVPVTRLAQEAPALCAAIVAAVAGDAALERLLPGGDLAGLAARAGDLSGATGPADIVAGVEALRTVLHRALRSDTDAALSADTADRLAHVCAHVTSAALVALTPPASGSPAQVPVPAPAPTTTHVGPPDPAGRILVAQDLRPDPRHLSALKTLLAERGSEPVAILAIEVDDLERLTAVEGGEAFTLALVPAEHALAAEVCSDGILVREGPGRWWLVAPGTDTDAARRLAHRVSRTLTAQAPVRHGVPLRASIGVAVCPDDGTTAPALADHADEGVFTARALGVSVA